MPRLWDWITVSSQCKCNFPDRRVRMIADYKVTRITYQEAIPMITKLHYAKRMPSVTYAFGLVKDSKLYGVCTFGSPASGFLCKGICGEQYKGIVLELNRLVVIAPEKNLASWFISRCIKQLPPEQILVSYADTKMTHIGYVYQATNWLYTGVTKLRTDRVKANGAHARHWDIDADSGNREIRSQKHRYIYFHKCSKEIKRSLRYPILPYPKGDTERYEVDITAIAGRKKRMFSI